MSLPNFLPASPARQSMIDQPESPSMSSPSVNPLRSAYLVVTLGFLAIFFEGYDLVVYGAVVPALLAYPDWNLTAASAGVLGAMALFGMVLGAPASGWLSDRFGRRRLFIGLLAFFSCMMIGVASAPTPEVLGLFRFLAGLGFGGIPPTVIALVIEFAPTRRRSLFTAITVAGFGVGAIVAGTLAVALLERIGFRGMFALGGLPLLTLVPLAIWLLPESPSFVRSAGESAPAQPAASPWAGVVRGRACIATALFAAANFFLFMLIFGLNTWLPVLMSGVGYELSVALKFLVVFNVGALVGMPSCAWLADRLGMRQVAAATVLATALCLWLLSIPASTPVTVIVIFIAGVTAGGCQAVLWSFVGTYYAAESRATAVGLTSGIGRLGGAAGPVIGGLLVSAGVGLSGNVVLLAAAAVLASVSVFLVPSSRPIAAPNPAAARLVPP